jgi:hypothetical protein
VRFTARASSSAVDRDVIEVVLPVIAAAAVETNATFLTVDGAATQSVAVPTDVFQTIGGLELRIASSALSEGTTGVDWLAHYRYGCAEQLASRLLGVIAAIRLGEGFAPAVLDSLPLQSWLAKVVERLAACQRPDGGFSFWPDGWASSPELSTHVAWALAAARAAGAPVGEDVAVSAAKYLSQLLRRDRWPGGASHGWVVRVLAMHALGHLGRGEPGFVQGILDRRRDEPMWARAVLAATMLAANPQDPRVSTLLGEVRNALAIEARTARLEERARDWGWLVWESEPRGSAAALLALTAAAPADPLGERLVRGLLDHLGRDGERTTHDTAWMLQALASYHERREAGAGARTATATFDGKRVLQASFASGPDKIAAVRVPMGELQARHAAGPIPLAIRVDGSGTVQATVVLTYASRRLDRPPLTQGLSLSRRFLDARGQAVSGVSAGDEVTVEVKLECPATRRFVAVEVPLPAGLEPVDPELATAIRRPAHPVDAEESEGEEARDDFWPISPGFDHVELRDDRVVLYASELPPGSHSMSLRCRATTAGSFLIAAGHASEMYAPEVLATTVTGSFEVLAGGR